DDDQIARDIELAALHLLAKQIAHRVPAQVHERLRFGQQDIVPCQLCRSRHRLVAAIADRDAEVRGDLIERQEPHVVRRLLVLRTRIAEPDDQLHAYFLAGAAGASSSVSCLPFLMTSGSTDAGAAATASAPSAGV